MNNKEYSKLDDSALDYVSGGVTVIDGFSYSVVKNDENKIFKYEVRRGDGTPVSEHAFRYFAENAAMDYRKQEMDNSVKRYESYLKGIENKLDFDG